MNSADDPKDKPALLPAELEIESLNVDDLDIIELERRLELAEGDIVGTECYIHSGCGSNCQSNSCKSYAGFGEDPLY